MAFSPSPAMYPFESRWFDSHAGRMHHLDEGSGRPLLMLHGNPTWSFLYRHLVHDLRDSFRCVAVDYLGFGLSDRPAAFGYTPAEHAATVGELVRHLDLTDAIVMGHDWGGPIGLSVAAEDPERFTGIVLGNTWFWEPDRRFRTFSRAMSSRGLQSAILRRNTFVERILPSGIVRSLSREEMDHYRGVQPDAASRIGVAEFPRQIAAAGPWLGRLEERVGRELAGKRALVTFPMRDVAFRPDAILPRFREVFRDLEVVELPEARHYFMEDAHAEVARAIRARFGSA